jgi:hypothetical protein
MAGDAPKGALRTPDAAAQAFKLHDLTVVLPKAKSEPVYVKSDWERELELRYKGAALFGRLAKNGVGHC